jgi:hypothetical protein
MATHYRFYLITSEGRLRIPVHVIDGLTPVPQYAGTRQREIVAIYECRGASLFLDVRGHYVRFDRRGVCEVSDEDLARAAGLMQVSDEIELQRRENPIVANADLYRRAKKLRSEGQWQPTQEDFAAVTADLMGRSRPPGTKSIPILKPLKRTPHPPADGRQFGSVRHGICRSDT